MAATDSARPDIRAAELNDHDAIVGPALRAWAPVYPSVHDALGPELARLCSPTTRSSPSTRPGVPARPVSTASPQQVWSAELRDGSTVVALFDLDATAAAATADRGDRRPRRSRPQRAVVGARCLAAQHRYARRRHQRATSRAGLRAVSRQDNAAGVGVPKRAYVG